MSLVSLPWLPDVPRHFRGVTGLALVEVGKRRVGLLPKGLEARSILIVILPMMVILIRIAQERMQIDVEFLPKGARLVSTNVGQAKRGHTPASFASRHCLGCFYRSLWRHQP